MIMMAKLYWGPKTSWHLSCRWGKTPKKPHPRNLSRPGIEPGPATWQARMLPPAPQRWTIILRIDYVRHSSLHFGRAVLSTHIFRYLLPFKIVAIPYNADWQRPHRFQKQSAKSPCGIDRRTAVTRTSMSFTFEKRAPLMGAFKRGNRRKFAGARSGKIRRVIKHRYHLPSQELAHTVGTLCRGIIVKQHPFLVLFLHFRRKKDIR